VGTLVVQPTETGGKNYPLRSGASDIRLIPAAYTFSSSYTTGGEACDPATQFPGVARSILVVHPMPAAGYVFQWLAGKIIAYQNGAEVAPGTNLNSLISTPVMMFVIARLRAR
jgi:hypothetical protein